MNKEILLVAEAVSNEKGVAKALIYEAIEAALAMATKKKYGREWEIKVSIDQQTGDYQTFRVWSVVEADAVEFPDRQMDVSQAQARDPTLQVGQWVEEPMESIEFGRIAAQTAKQVIVQKVRDAERAKIADAYEARLGELVSGTVKRVTREVVFLELPGNAEAMIARENLIPKENIRVGDRVRAYLSEICRDARGPQLILTRTAPEMLIELFRIEVPEIAEGIIEIKGASRDPGARAKIAVRTSDGRIDPIGACVGMRGSRVQAVSGQLGGERVDIILWDPDPVKLVINAMAPAEVSSILMNEETHTMMVVVDESQLSQAIGRGGQNVRLASKLTGWEIKVMTQEVASVAQSQSSQSLLALFAEHLDVDEEIAQVLIDEGFASLDDIAYVGLDELTSVEGFDEEIAAELQTRAKEALLAQMIVADKKLPSVPAQDLLTLTGMTGALADRLAQHGIVTREDLAEKAVDELTEVDLMSEAEARQLIMEARKHWFLDEQEKGHV
jgi:N utilization substance protein A